MWLNDSLSNCTGTVITLYSMAVSQPQNVKFYQPCFDRELCLISRSRGNLKVNSALLGKIFPEN